MPDLAKLRWMLNRLSSMSAAEVLHRIKERNRRGTGRKLQCWDRFALDDVRIVPLAFNRDALSELHRTCGSGWQRILEQARAGRWHYLGQDWPGTTGKTVWHLDPVTCGNWPSDRYCFDIDFRHERVLGDIKYVWELNRLQFLPPIAALAAASGDSAAAEFCSSAIMGWADANPPFSGVNWGSGIELALRAISILTTVSLLGPDSFSATQIDRIGTILNAHAHWLMRYPSAHSSANNHLIAEAAGLYLLGSLVPTLPGADAYHAYGKRVLEVEAERQILADGVGAEQSPTYSAFALELYCMALAVARTRGESFAPAVSERLRAAGSFLRWITDENGNHPRFGDDDEGRVLVSSPDHEAFYVASIMGSVAATTGRPDIAPPVATPHLRQLFFGAAPAQDAGPVGRKSFDEGGYSVFRDRIAGRDVLLAFDHGPLGYLSIAAHGHADALAVWLHVDGQPAIIDAGTYLYHSGGAERDRFRGTAAHNTLEINGADQSVVSGAFNWSHKARAWRLPEEPADGAQRNTGVTARHDGFARRFGAVHERRVLQNAAGFDITDRLAGSSDKVCQTVLRYYLDPAIEARRTEAGSVLLMHADTALVEMVLTASNGAVLPALLEDTEMSPRFGLKQRTTRIAWDVPPARLVEPAGVTLSLRFE